MAAKGHFNPKNHTHGGPSDDIRHYGDLGNVLADENGAVSASISDSLVTLYGEESVLGRSCMLHALEDDLGRGNNAESLITGNAGARWACGVVGMRNAGQ